MGYWWRARPDRIKYSCTFCIVVSATDCCSEMVRAEMFAAVQKTQELWMWKMEYLHHEQRPLYFGEWF